MFNSFNQGGISRLFGDSEPSAQRGSLIDDVTAPKQDQSNNGNPFESHLDNVAFDKSVSNHNLNDGAKEDVYFSMTGWSNRSGSNSPRKQTSPLQQSQSQQQQQQQKQSNQDSFQVHISPNHQQNSDLNQGINVISPLSDNVSFGVGVGDQGAFVKLDGGVGQLNKSNNSTSSPNLNNKNGSGGGFALSGESNLENQRINNRFNNNKNIGTSLSSVSQINNGEITANTKSFINSNSGKSRSSALSSAAARKEMSKSRRYLRCFIIYSMITFLMFLITVTMSLMSFSCTDLSNGFCTPYVSIQFDDDNELYADSPLQILNQAVKIISHYLNDSPDFDLDLRFTDMKDANFFSNKDILKLNQWGYCKYDKELEVQQCFDVRRGFDLPSVLVEDAGYQVGLYIGHPNPKRVGHLFARNYFFILKNLMDNMKNYNNSNINNVNTNEERNIKREIAKINAGVFSISSNDENDYHFLKYLLRINLLATVLQDLSFIQVLIIFVTFLFSLISMFVMSSKERFENRTLLFIAILNGLWLFDLIALIISICFLASLTLYFLKLENYLMDFAVVEFSSAYYIHFIGFIPAQLIIVTTLTYFVFKKPWISK